MSTSPTHSELKSELIVKDDFFNEDICNLVAQGTKHYQWLYHHKSDMGDQTHNKFFISHLWNDRAEQNLFYMLWSMIKKGVPNLEKYYCFRIHANGQVKGQNGNWHSDYGDKTVIYFPLEWMPEWDGSTYFKAGCQETEIKYKKNRIVVFDSEMLHYGSCPSCENIFRITIVFDIRSSEQKA